MCKSIYINSTQSEQHIHYTVNRLCYFHEDHNNATSFYSTSIQESPELSLSGQDRPAIRHREWRGNTNELCNIVNQVT